MAYSSVITETTVFTVLRTFLLSIVSCEVVRAQDNRVPMVEGPALYMTQLGIYPLERNRNTVSAITTEIVTPSRMDIQLDCYGKDSHDRAQAINALFNDDFAFQAFQAISGDDEVRPLYAEDPTQIPLINGEDQYEERWTVRISLQVNHTIVVDSESANRLAMGTAPEDQTEGTVIISGDGINLVV